MPTTLREFLDRFGEPLAQRVAQTFQILHDPLRDAGATPALDAVLATLPRKCYPAQAEAAKALAKALFVEGQRAAFLTAEMGVGMGQIALTLIALAPRPLRVLVMCPPHLVPKWEREAQAVLSHVRTVSLGGRDSLTHLIRLAAALRQYGTIAPSTPEVWVLSRERAKLHYAWQPATLRRRMHRRDPAGVNPLGHTPPLVTWFEPACIRCGGFLRDTDGLPFSEAQLTRKHTFCPTCNEPAFARVNLRRRSLSGRGDPDPHPRRHVPGARPACRGVRSDRSALR
jgi:hypothetical protein